MATDLTKFKVLSFSLPIETCNRLDRLSEKGGLSRTQLIVNLVLAGVDFLETCEGWGVYAVKKIFDDMRFVLSKRVKYKVA
jgi:predicted DNA-binding protein